MPMLAVLVLACIGAQAQPASGAVSWNSVLRQPAAWYAGEEAERIAGYVLAWQNDNGGWPQFYPLRDGYYSHITFNDDAMIGVMRLLGEVGDATAPFSFVDRERRERARRAVARGLAVILETQIEVDGTLTAWCAQYDEQTLGCAPARSYELASLSGSESVGIVRYLMSIDDPGPDVIRTVVSAAAWFDRVKLEDIRLVRKTDPTLARGFDLVVGFDPMSTTPMWARFYEIGTNRPLFVDRDGTQHDAFSEIEYERRVGYSWLGSWAAGLLATEYPAWRRRRVADNEED